MLVIFSRIQEVVLFCFVLGKIWLGKRFMYAKCKSSLCLFILFYLVFSKINHCNCCDQLCELNLDTLLHETMTHKKQYMRPRHYTNMLSHNSYWEVLKNEVSDCLKEYAYLLFPQMTNETKKDDFIFLWSHTLIIME